MNAGTRTPRIAVAHTGTGSQLAALADPALQPYRIEPVYLPDVIAQGTDAAEAALAEVDVLLVADRDHPAVLQRSAGALLSVADRGGVVAVFGENSVQDWVLGAAWQARPINFWWWRTQEDSGMRLRSPGHDLWSSFSEKAMIWHHHGVLTPPDGATVLVALEEGGVETGATIYHDAVSTPGELLVTTMDPMFHHGAAFMPGATQLLYQTLRWAEVRARDRIAAGLLSVG